MHKLMMIFEAVFRPPVAEFFSRRHGQGSADKCGGDWSGGQLLGGNRMPLQPPGTCRAARWHSRLASQQQQQRGIARHAEDERQQAALSFFRQFFLQHVQNDTSGEYGEQHADGGRSDLRRQADRSPDDDGGGEDPATNAAIGCPVIAA